jgi:hypothetical protein
MTGCEPVADGISHESADAREFAGSGTDDAKLTGIIVIAAASSTPLDDGRVHERLIANLHEVREGMCGDAW